MKVYYFLFGKKSNSSASFNRVNLFAEGLNSQGVIAKVNVIDLAPFRFPLLNKLFAPILLIYYFSPFIIYIHNSVLIFYGESVAYRFFSLLRKFNTIIVERNEFPTHLIWTDGVSKKMEKFCISFLLSLKYVDAFITCSNELKTYYLNYLQKDTPIFISPLIVKVSEFDQYRGANENKISYCGDWGNNKDGVDILIQAFALIHSKYPALRLSLIGGSTEQVERKLHDLVEELNIKPFVDFVGRVDHNNLPNYLSSSRILVLARPANKQAAGGIPSKVAEYLSTKRPVVLTDVGELRYFLQDGKNCYMCKPDSSNEFANKMDYALSDCNSGIIGINGYNTVLQFDYISQSKSLSEFLKKIHNV